MRLSAELFGFERLLGEGGGGRLAPQVAWQGWVAAGTVWVAGPEWANTQLQAYFPPEPPPDASRPPEGGGVYTLIRVVPRQDSNRRLFP